jgi:hypothetical protein
MANPYYTTITFPLETLGSGDTWQLILTLTHNTDGSNASVNAEDQGLLITDHGKTKWDFNINDLTLMPGETTLSIADTEDYLHDFLFGISAVALATDKRPKVDIYLNSAIEFSGYFIEDDVQYNMGTKLLRFSAAPKIDILKNTPLYDDDDVYTNPLSYPALTAERKLIDIVDDIMQYAFPGIVGTVYQDWTFVDVNDDIWTFSQIYAKLISFYANGNRHLNDLTEVLREVIQCVCSRLVICNSSSYLIEKIGYYDSGDTQTLTVLDHTKEMLWSQLQYARFQAWDEVSSQYDYKTSGTKTNLESAKIERDFILYTKHNPIDPGVANSIVYSYSGGTYYKIKTACDPMAAPLCEDLLIVAAASYVTYRGASKNMINHKFKCSGVGYVLGKACVYDSGYYQINKMVKDWENGTTDIEAIYCAAVT